MVVRERPILPLFPDWTIWTSGNTGSEGSFNDNGTALETKRVIYADPWGRDIVCWQGIPDSSNNADGGWAYVTSDNCSGSKLYRYSVWIKRTGNHSGTTYFGAKQNSVYRLDTGEFQGNPYFMHGDPPSYGDWYLWVGHIWPSSETRTEEHEDTGIWSLSKQRYSPTVRRDMKWSSQNLSHNHRTYLYYCTLTSNRSYWCYPRIDLCDGNEPSLDSLLGGFDSINYDYIKAVGGDSRTGAGVDENGIWRTTKISEVGPTSGMIAYWPFDGDYNDYSGNEYNFVNTNTTLTDGIRHSGALFTSGNSSTLRANSDITIGLSGLTISMWIKPHDTYGMSLILCNSAAYILHYRGAGFYLKASDDVTSGYLDWNTEATENVWSHLAATWDSETMKLYLNGYKQTSELAYSGGSTGVLKSSIWTEIGYRFNDSQARYSGQMDDVRIYDRALDSEEIKILYDMYNPSGEVMMKITDDDKTYLRGIIKEN